MHIVLKFLQQHLICTMLHFKRIPLQYRSLPRHTVYNRFNSHSTLDVVILTDSLSTY